MDFPMFHLDWLNDRFLIAAIAILHVFINHGLAVGFIPYITWLELKSIKKTSEGLQIDTHWDDMVYRKMQVAFIITTTIGAMTGVGIWFSAALVSPSSIGSLIRVFFWGWFTEWIIFIAEVVFIMIYFLKWKQANQSVASKLRHIQFGKFLGLFSWGTMAIIVAILSFMMDPGNWNKSHSFLHALINPLYLPQLLFRTPTALLVGGGFGMLLTTIFTKKNSEIRIQTVKITGKWILFWSWFALVGASVYWLLLPEAMKANMSVAVGTQLFAQYYDMLIKLVFVSVFVALILAWRAIRKPQTVQLPLALVSFLLVLAFLGSFERVREFVRKPYIISGYMYSNLLRVEDYPLYKRDGILKHATYTSVVEITDLNKVEAGKNVFMLTCSRCHTTQGVNSVVTVFERMYGAGKPFDEAAIEAYIPTMHKVRTYMPPFPGNQKEMGALAAYIKYLQQSKQSLQGAQTEGVAINPARTAESAAKALAKSN